MFYGKEDVYWKLYVQVMSPSMAPPVPVPQSTYMGVPPTSTNYVLPSQQDPFRQNFQQQKSNQQQVCIYRIIVVY